MLKKVTKKEEWDFESGVVNFNNEDFIISQNSKMRFDIKFKEDKLSVENVLFSDF